MRYKYEYHRLGASRCDTLELRQNGDRFWFRRVSQLAHHFINVSVNFRPKFLPDLVLQGLSTPVECSACFTISSVSSSFISAITRFLFITLFICQSGQRLVIHLRYRGLSFIYPLLTRYSAQTAAPKHSII